MDFLPEHITSETDATEYIGWFVSKYYNHNFLSAECFYGLNLIWPKFDLPRTYKKYIISFHTEYLDIDWIIAQATNVYPKSMLLITDYNIISNSAWPDNITFAQVHTLHHQLSNAISVFDLNTQPKKPNIKISSLSMRTTQYKNFVTSYLLKNFPQDQMILSYHRWVAKSEDLHNSIQLDHLKDLNLDIPKTLINTTDESNIINQSPLKNSNWHVPAYTNALFNLTNESWHYTKTIKNNKEFVYPGAYLTEKTFKPLLAGRPFIPVGQAGTTSTLEKLGFSLNFGLDFSYDNDDGDLTRIAGVFSAINEINNKSLDNLYENSLKSVLHNIQHIRSGNFWQICEEKNQFGYAKIQAWFA